jgi:hypothetical protein
MSKHQLTETLQKLFQDGNQRIVFWYDAEKEFEDGLSDLNLDGVKVIFLNQTATLEVKILLEMHDTVGKYLLYAPFAEPDVKDDWLSIWLYCKRTCNRDSMARAEELKPYITADY